MPQPSQSPESRRLLEKLIREIGRAELQAVDHPVREARRIGEVPPVRALREVALHAAIMRARLEAVLVVHDVPFQRTGIGATLATLRHLVVDRIIDDERSFRTALLDLRHGLDVVRLLREVARREVLFGVIRWCDAWLGARRTLVARVEAQLGWFAERSLRPAGYATLPLRDDETATRDADGGDDFEVRPRASDSETRPSSRDRH